MRAYLVVSHKFQGEINLNDLPGSGRIDVICRGINAAIFLSHTIRKDVIFLAYFSKLNALLKIDASRVRYLNPDERSTAALIRNAVIKLSDHEVQTSPGFFIKKATFTETLQEAGSLGKLLYLREDGKDIQSISIPKNVVFILSDNVNMRDEEEKEIYDGGAEVISVGPQSLLSSHVIAIVNNELDRRGL